MKIAVVTPVYQTRPSWLGQCLASVRAQSLPATHFLVNDGDASLTQEAFPGIEFLSLPRPHRDVGNAARAIGSISAISHGFDAIAYLDADNWFEPDHLQELAALHKRTRAAVCSAARNLVDLEGHLLGPCPETDGENLVDTNMLFLTRAAFGLVATWFLMPPALSLIGDRLVWKAVKDQKLRRAHCQKRTVNYRSNYSGHYTYFGKTPPPGAKHLEISRSRSGDIRSVKVLVKK